MINVAAAEHDVVDEVILVGETADELGCQLLA
jgi:hypothetical protein